VWIADLLPAPEWITLCFLCIILSPF